MADEMYFDSNEQQMPRTIRRRKKQLYAAIRERMEFYFSDANLQKDRYLTRLISKDPEIELKEFLKFNRILQLTNNIQDLGKALKKSEILKLTEDKLKVFRITPIKEKTNTDACTIYVEQLSCDADHDWLKDVFSQFGKVDYVSIPKYKNSGKIKGFAFVEFESPEIAQKALKEFEKAGCCLTNQMNPEQLCSIATFEDDKVDNKNQHAHQANESNGTGQANGVPESDAEKREGRKRKNSEGMPLDECEPKEKKSRKSEDDAEGNKSNEENEKSDHEGEEPKAETATNEAEEATVLKKKKNRKKKKSHRTKCVRDIPSYGLQILSKADWKRLRNKYLNIQKEKMKKLKQHLYKSQINHSQRQQQQHQQQQQQQQPPQPQIAEKPRFEFKTGVVVKIILDEPLENANQMSQFKCNAKTLDNVEYVDVTQGSVECFVRFGSEDAVREVMRSKPWENMHVLEGEEERDYWEKMKRDRSEKFENRKKFNNKRGRNKLITKAEKLISKRIRLSVDE